MNTYADKAQENKSPSITTGISKDKNGQQSPLHFVDNRPEATFQRKLQKIANDNQQAQQLHQMKRVLDTSARAPSNNAAVVQRLGWLPFLATIASVAAHQIMTYVNKKNMESNESLEGKEDPYGEGGNGTLQIRKYQAFVENQKNPFWHVWLTYKFEDGTVFKVAERGNGKESWQSYPVISETKITNNQLARLLEKDDDVKDKYWPALYGPGWNDCHTWLQIVQKFAGINAPLSTPRFNTE